MLASHRLAPSFHRQTLTKPLQIGAEEYRRLQEEGETSWPAPAKLGHAKDIFLPSRESDREIRCRLLQPQDGSSKGVFLYFHGGGYTLGHSDW
jgi:acetyl esterase/lipase